MTLFLHVRAKLISRRTEWTASFQSLLWGIILLWPGMNVFGSSKAFGVVSQIMPEGMLGSIMLVFGLLRIAGLIINGKKGNVTPWVRVTSALVGCGVFTFISLSFAATGVVSTWIAAWPVLAVTELFNLHSSTRDAKIANG